MEQYLTSQDVADFLKLSVKTIERYAKKRKIPSYKIAGKWRFRSEEISKWVLTATEDQEPKAAPKKAKAKTKDNDLSDEAEVEADG